MRIMVLAFAGFREILGKERELRLLEGATVKELLEELALANPRFKEAAFDESGELRDYVLLMVNRKRIDPLQDLSRTLQEGDELAIFPPLAGG
ncbi:MAG: MoaD/ThiS family protein [Methanothrix sp.]|nr:MoaD/ThiS family protein [Methanothrix sp.]